MSILPTPKWNIQKVIEKDIYEPAEDTFLLIDAIEDDILTLFQLKPKVIVEVGCGSGVVITAMSSIFQDAAYCLALDINENACSVTRDTALLNNVQVDVLHCDLLNCFRLYHMIDVIIFNPPYVRTESDEVLTKGISQAWAGGLSGREVIDKLLPDLYSALTREGMFYLVAIEYNMMDDIYKKMDKFGFNGTLIKKRQIRGELLSVLRFTKKLD